MWLLLNVLYVTVIKFHATIFYISFPGNIQNTPLVTAFSAFHSLKH